MIVADKKPIEEIIDTVKDFRNILVLGCNECVTVCEAGGKKEVGLLAEVRLPVLHRMLNNAKLERNVLVVALARIAVAVRVAITIGVPIGIAFGEDPGVASV